MSNHAEKPVVGELPSNWLARCISESMSAEQIASAISASHQFRQTVIDAVEDESQDPPPANGWCGPGYGHRVAARIVQKLGALYPSYEMN
jgi:hypothetical protein